jgi:hypothetical protein
MERGEITGGTSSRCGLRRLSRRSPWTAKICCLFSTPAVPPASPRVWCIPPAGYNLYTHVTTKWTFDLKDTDIYWCTADVGWITGHSYIVYGPLSNGATTVMYEGVPRPSNPGCFWDVIEKYGVTIFYTAPTAIRAFIKMGDEHPKARDLSSLRLSAPSANHQPRSLDVVSHRHRQRALPHR